MTNKGLDLGRTDMVKLIETSQVRTKVGAIFRDVSGTVLSLIIGCFAPLSAAAQGVNLVHEKAGAGDFGQPCELHVWTSSDYHSEVHGLFEDGMLGALGAPQRAASAHNAQQQLRMFLDSEAQFNVIRNLDWSGLFHDRNVKFVKEENQFSWKEVKSFKRNNSRKTLSIAPCYVELILSTIVYNKATLYKTKLFVNLLYRDFRNEGRNSNNLTYGSSVLGKFPARFVDEEEGASAEIRDAFGAAIIESSRKAFSSPR